MKNVEKLNKLTDDFKACQTVLTAIGDSTRQSIIITLIAAGCEDGMRVGEITRKTHLSRPAVSPSYKSAERCKGCQCKTCCDDEFLLH